MASASWLRGAVWLCSRGYERRLGLQELSRFCRSTDDGLPLSAASVARESTQAVERDPPHLNSWVCPVSWGCDQAPRKGAERGERPCCNWRSESRKDRTGLKVSPQVRRANLCEGTVRAAGEAQPDLRGNPEICRKSVAVLSEQCTNASNRFASGFPG